jgi:hypothetical protein
VARRSFTMTFTSRRAIVRKHGIAGFGWIAVGRLRARTLQNGLNSLPSVSRASARRRHYRYCRSPPPPSCTSRQMRSRKESGKLRGAKYTGCPSHLEQRLSKWRRVGSSLTILATVKDLVPSTSSVSVIPPIAAAALCIKPIAMPIEHRREDPSVKKCIGRRHARRTSDAQGRFMSGREPSSSGPRKVELMPLAPRLLLDTIWGPCSWRVWFRVGSPWRIGTPFPLSTLAWLMATRVHVETSAHVSNSGGIALPWARKELF